MRLWRRCGHLNRRTVYGDEIWARMSAWRGTVYREACVDCGKSLKTKPTTQQKVTQP